jgi:hypothetical protein
MTVQVVPSKGGRYGSDLSGSDVVCGCSSY